MLHEMLDYILRLSLTSICTRVIQQGSWDQSLKPMHGSGLQKDDITSAFQVYVTNSKGLTLCSETLCIQLQKQSFLYVWHGLVFILRQSYVDDQSLDSDPELI